MADNSTMAANSTMVANSTNAAQQVFDIPELLEHILSFLQIRELLGCQQVCVSFRNATHTSIKIRQKLCLLASMTSAPLTETISRRQDPKKPVYNPLFWNFQGLWADTRVNRVTGEYVLYLHAHGHKQREPAMPDGSWRSMLISQPPVKTRMLRELYRPGVRRHWLPTDRVAVMEKPTMGELVDRLRYDGVLL